MSRSRLMTAIGEASYIDDQSNIPKKINSQLSKRLSHKGAFPDFLPEHTSAVSWRHAVLTIPVEPRLAPLQRLELTTIKGPLKRWRASVDHPSPRQHNMKVKN